MAGRHGFLHVFAAIAHGAHGVGELQGPGGHVGGVLTKAVPGRKLLDHAFFLQHSCRGSAHREDGGLGNLRHLQLIVRAFTAELGEREAQGFIGFLEGVAGDGIERGQFFAHACRL